VWKLKVLIQFVLAHLPKGEQINYLLQTLNNSHSPQKIAERIPSLLRELKRIDQYVELQGSSVLEIGTGWNAISALLLYLIGAKTVYTYDHVGHVRYKLLQNVINQMENQIEQIQSITSIPKSELMDRLAKVKDGANTEAIFERASIVYKAPGDAARSGLPDDSIDLVYSTAVLEHVRESVIHDLTVETKRVLKQNGVAYHSIALHDHYVSFDRNISKVNFLRYPEWMWRFFVKNKISYHNRLREKQFIEIFKSHAGKIKMIDNKIDPEDLEVLKTMKVDKRFLGMTPEELAVCYTKIVFSFQ